MASKKRAAGEGCVRQRSDGKWEAYTSRDAFGKRRKVVRATQRDALSALAGLKAQPSVSAKAAAAEGLGALLELDDDRVLELPPKVRA